MEALNVKRSIVKDNIKELIGNLQAIERAMEDGDYALSVYAMSHLFKVTQSYKNLKEFIEE